MTHNHGAHGGYSSTQGHRGEPAGPIEAADIFTANVHKYNKSIFLEKELVQIKYAECFTRHA